MFDPTSVRFRGPLTAHAHGFWAELQRQSYTRFSARNLLLLAAHFSRWLDDRELGLTDLSAERLALFLAHRRRRGYTSFLSSRGLGPLLAYLRGVGVVVRPTPVIETSTDRLLQEYAQFLARERSLYPGSISQYLQSAREFAIARFGSEEPRWNRLTAAAVTTFVMQQSRGLSVGYCKHKISELRSFLRFLHVRSHIASSLAECVPAVAGWRLASLPKALEPDQIDRLLAQLAPSFAIRRRDAAMVRLQLRLGLRAGDVAALELDDLDWRAGEMVVRGKGQRESRLPLPEDVGQAMAAYLRRHRPRALTRKVFLRSRAPYRGLSSGGVITATRSALRRAGIMAGGAHLLRHTAATQMLRKGASLSEIAHVLRHRHIDPTAIYAKVDHASLQLVVRPWPESGR
jgi:integrase/recombinase XerD